MNSNQWNDLVKEILDNCASTLVKKNAEYANGSEDVLINLKKGAVLSGKTKEEVLDGYRLKHLVSIKDIRERLYRDETVTVEMLHEKFGDAINYFILEFACLVELNEANIINKVRKTPLTPEECYPVKTNVIYIEGLGSIEINETVLEKIIPDNEGTSWYVVGENIPEDCIILRKHGSSLTINYNKNDIKHAFKIGEK